MRLKVKFEMDGNTFLPYSYRKGLQAFIYSALDDYDSSKLHDMDGGLIKPFVFSNIIGNYTPTDDGLFFKGNCVFYIASPQFQILDEFYNFVVEKKTLSLYGNYIPLTSISQFLYKGISGPVAYRTISPATVYEKKEDGSFVFFGPESREFKQHIYNNIAHKYRETFGQEMNEYLNIYKISDIRHQVVSYKDFTYEAYDMSFVADCSEKIHSLMMDLGIGYRNAIGMGMIEYNDRKKQKTE